ncbi:MAG: molybdopterin-dependent oxidoreductase [Thermoleophilia bacterium]|nr:molybdopterin-dependent oxidoreductase [Thermoleophilia bacterium]
MSEALGDKENVQERKVVCWASPGCIHQCGLIATVKDGRLVGLKGNRDYPTPNHGCNDRMPYHINWLYSSDQLLHPLKRKGERGENQWEHITWDQALDEIAAKLAELRDKYGPETLALHEGTYRSDLYGIRTRFLNLFGNPSNIGCAGTICRCNTVAMNLALLGTVNSRPKLDQVKCVVLHGCNLPHTAPLDWQRLKTRLEQKAVKLIVIDPRKTEAGRYADIWVQLRPGTDAALLLAWINVIIEEGLYDKDFVNEWTFGFDKLRERAAEYTPEKVADTTWVSPEVIRASARLYATNWPAGFHWGSATDMLGRNSIRVEQARICLRALTGNLKVGGGEMVVGPGPIVDGKLAIRDAMLALPEKVSPEQRKKQIGSDRFKLMGWPGYEAMAKYYEQTYGVPFPVAAHNFVAVQPLIWKAVLEEDPYPIKAMISWGSNVLLNGGEVKLMYRALKSPNLELHVVLDHFLTPTAQLADYVLPAASKLEKPMCATHEDFAPNIACAEAAVEPLGERRSDYHFWRGLAQRLGFGEYFPWETEEELADYRLAPLGLTFKEVATQKYFVRSDEPWTYLTINPRTGKPTGFATPSGKVELYSQILEQLGYDPLPYYEEPPESPISTPDIAKEYPYILITGGNFRPMFHSENRQLGIGTREQYPDPVMDIHPETARTLDIEEGDWVFVETRRGVIRQRAHLTDEIDPRVINVQSHWWFPELPPREPWLGGLWESNANVLTWADDPETFDPVTGGWPLRALLCKVYKMRTVDRSQTSERR